MQIKLTISLKETNLEEIKERALQISNDNPMVYITFSVKNPRVFIYLSSPQRDSYDTAQTYEEVGGFFKAGGVVLPSEDWIKMFSFADNASTCDVVN